MTRRRTLARLFAMDRSELAWRSRAAARIALNRTHFRLRSSAWNRRALAGILTAASDMAVVRRAAAAGRWVDAHAALGDYFATAPQRFVIAPALRQRLAERVRARFPDAARDAAGRADRLLAGEYDLLGYRALRFGMPPQLDWHLDPVHNRQAPRLFWAAVPFLDPSCGDHKITWELNRHQHWLTLGRAYWLTGNQQYRDRIVGELSTWLDANPPLVGINWASMLELAFRSMSWVWAVHFFSEHAAADREPWLVDLLIGLDRQLDHVEHNLSYYFSPNTHLLGEALALYVAGRTLPLLASSARREETGRAILLAEAERQIVADGGHCERSTHYHRYTLDFYLLALTIARITADPAAADFQRAVARLAFAGRLLADDRGRLPHIGDDDGGATMPLTGRAVDDIGDSLMSASLLVDRQDLRVGPIPEETLWLLAHPTLADRLDAAAATAPIEAVGSAAMPDSGYYVSRSPAGDHLVIDAGPLGYQNGGHAHADALSMTLGVRGTPLLIDSGTACYTVDPALRDRFRSTAAHNTLTLDGRPQSVPSGPFHWSHSAHAAARCWRANASFDYLEASHDGYAPIEHRRHVLALHGDLLVVADLVNGTGVHRADVHWHIDPRWQLAISGERALMTSATERVQLFTTQGRMQAFSGDEPTGLGWHAPVYGRVEAAHTIRVTHTGAVPLWIVSVFGLNGANEVTAVETLPVWAEAGVLSHSLAVRITRANSTDHLLVADRSEREAVVNRTWRVGEIETDARMLFCRTESAGQISEVAVVDGSVVRASGHRRFALLVPREVPDLHVDLRHAPGAGSPEEPEARLSGPAFGVRIQLGGRDVAVAVERRSLTRPRASRR